MDRDCYSSHTNLLKFWSSLNLPCFHTTSRVSSFDLGLAWYLFVTVIELPKWGKCFEEHPWTWLFHLFWYQNDFCQILGSCFTNKQTNIMPNPGQNARRERETRCARHVWTGPYQSPVLHPILKRLLSFKPFNVFWESQNQRSRDNLHFFLQREDDRGFYDAR